MSHFEVSLLVWKMNLRNYILSKLFTIEISEYQRKVEFLTYSPYEYRSNLWTFVRQVLFRLASRDLIPRFQRLVKSWHEFTNLILIKFIDRRLYKMLYFKNLGDKWSLCLYKTLTNGRARRFERKMMDTERVKKHFCCH